MAILVASLHRYVVKSCRGEALDRAVLDRRGVVDDRRFMVVDPAGGFLTQRQLPALALIAPRLAPGRLTLTAPGMPDLDLDLAEPRQRRPISVWEHRGMAEDAGAAATAWLEAVLGTPARLARMPDDAVRPVDRRYAAPGDQTGFSDGFPLGLVNLDSLAALNARLDGPVPIDRFRANLVIAGARAFAEDGWRRIRVNGVELAVVKPCARCATVTVDQSSAARGPEPLRTLARFRTREGKVLFGQNLAHRGLGELRVGEAVEVLDP